MQISNIHNIKDQIIKVVLHLRQAPEFIRENKLWKGYLSIGWISKLSVLVAIVFSYTFITGIIGLFDTPEPTEIAL